MLVFNETMKKEYSQYLQVRKVVLLLRYYQGVWVERIIFVLCLFRSLEPERSYCLL